MTDEPVDPDKVDELFGLLLDAVRPYSTGEDQARARQAVEDAPKTGSELEAAASLFHEHASIEAHRLGRFLAVVELLTPYAPGDGTIDYPAWAARLAVENPEKLPALLAAIDALQPGDGLV